MKRNLSAKWKLFCFGLFVLKWFRWCLSWSTMLREVNSKHTLRYRSMSSCRISPHSSFCKQLGHLPDTENCGLCMRLECQERFPHRRLHRKPLVSDPDIHHGTSVTHVPWCILGSLTFGGGENVPGIPGACAPAILRIWQKAHSHQIGVLDKSGSKFKPMSIY